MNFFKRLFSKQKEAKVVTLGVSGAGKTTLIKYLETGEVVEQDPQMTLGIDIREKGIDIGSWKVSAIDVGGQELYQNTLWALGVTQSDGVIYLIDGTTKEDVSPEAFEESLFSFKYMLSIVSPKKPLLIIVNKQDLREKHPYGAQDAVEKYEIHELTGRSFNIIEGSAKFGDGLEVGLNWVMNKIEERED